MSLSRPKKAAFTIVIAVVFFAGLELALWALGVPTLLAEQDPFRGFSDVVGVFERDPTGAFYRTAPRATRHSFNRQQFAVAKPAAGFRVFILGGSSAYGFPWGAERSFSRPLGDALAAALPDCPVEVVNAAAMSYGTHRLRILVDELLRYEPDLFIVYSGHNEFVEREFFADFMQRSRRLDGARAALGRWRLYSLLSRLRSAPVGDGSGAGDGKDLLGLDVARERELVESSAEKEAAGRQLRANLDALVTAIDDASVPVILCTVPANLTGWAPNDSLFRADLPFADRRQVERRLEGGRAALAAGRPGAAATALAAAKTIAPEHAEARFRLGQAELARDRPAAALSEFRAALEADARPTRALAAFNDHIRALARDRAVPLLDVEALFTASVDDGLLGFNLFQDYVHPKPQAHRLIAFGLYRLILELGLAGPPATAERARFERAAGAVELASAAGAGPDGQDQDDKTPALLFNLGVVLEHQGATEEAIANYRACLRRHPQHVAARQNLARLLGLSGAHEEAIIELERLLRSQPDDIEALATHGRVLTQLGRVEEGLAELQRVIELAPTDPTHHQRLGLTLLNGGRHGEAEEPLRRAAELRPDDHRARSYLAAALMFQGKLDQAEAEFARSLELEPEQLDSLNGLAFIAMQRGDRDAAAKRFREALALDPEDRRARAGLAGIQQR